MTIIYVASTSSEKIKATENGWKLVHPNDPVTVVPLKNASDVLSLVPDQPLNDDIVTGAQCRMNALEKLHHDELREGDYLVSFESGIWVESSSGEAQCAEYADYGEEGTICMVVKVQYPASRCAYEKSECRRYPYHVIKQAQKEGITVLKDQDKRVGAWFKQNPTPSGSSREQVMANVFAKTLAKL